MGCMVIIGLENRPPVDDAGRHPDKPAGAPKTTWVLPGGVRNVTPRRLEGNRVQCISMRCNLGRVLGNSRALASRDGSGKIGRGFSLKYGSECPRCREAGWPLQNTIKRGANSTNELGENWDERVGPPRDNERAPGGQLGETVGREKEIDTPEGAGR